MNSPISGAQMSANSTRAAPSKKRTKTFTGCWTCRERKIKCDETHPRCKECRRRKLACEGYGARLQWLPPILPCDSGNNGHEHIVQQASGALRRVLPAGELVLLVVMLPDSSLNKRRASPKRPLFRST